MKVISRDPQEYAQDKAGNGVKLVHNTKPSLHPFQLEREYVRAVNSVKMESILATTVFYQFLFIWLVQQQSMTLYVEIFAKPFVAALSGHIDGVNALARHPTRQNCIISGGSDGGMANRRR